MISYKNVIIVFMLLLPNVFFGQSLSLDNIFKIHSLDSNSLKKFCIENGLICQMVDEDDWVFEYSITTNARKKLYATRTFPKDENAPPFVRYYFDDEQEYKNFEESIKASGFVRIKYKPIGKKVKTEIATKYYLNTISKMEIGMEKYNTGSPKYALTLSVSQYE